MRKQTHVLLIMFFLFSLMKAPAVRAAQDPDVYSGIDVIFLVDQSGSMSGLCNGCPFNDRLDLRFYSLSYAMKWMGENYIGVDTNKIPFRVAIINFGSTVEPWDFDTSDDHQYWQEIAPVSQSEWDTLYKKIESDIEMMTKKYKGKSLGNTDFKPAFEQAKMFFSEEYLPVPEGENHRQVIVVLTDGRPNPAIQPDGFTLSRYMNDLLQYTEAGFPEPAYRIYVVGLPDQLDPHWSIMRPAWEMITNDPCPGANSICADLRKDRASLVASDQEVGNRFLNLMLDLTNIKEIVIPPGRNILPPYLKTAIFTLFKDDNIEHLILTNPNGVQVSDSDLNVQITGQNGPIEVVRINSPLPGEWLVVTQPANENVIITKREIYAQSRLDSPLSTQIQYLPVNIRYALLDEIGDPLPNYGNEYPLIVEAEIQAGSQKWPLILKDVQSGSVYEGNFTPVEAGEYKLVVHAWTKDIIGQLVEVYKGTIGSFIVSKAVLAPANLPTSWPQYQPRDLIFELRNEEGYPISTATAASEIKIVAEIFMDGNVDGEPFSLISQDDGTYKGSYAPQQQGEHTLHVLGTIRDNSGNTHVIIDSDVGTFVVDPTTRVIIKLIQPANPVGPSGNIFKDNNTEAWSFSRKPMNVEVVLVDDQGVSIPLARAFKDPARALLLELDDENGDPIPGILDFKLDNVTGHYNAETIKLGVGEYYVTIRGNELNPGFVYQETELPIQITRITNPWLVRTEIMSLLFLAIALPLGIGRAVTKVRRQRHPCQGKIYIVDGYAAPKFQKILDIERSNRIIYSSKDIDQMTQIRQIILECKTDADSRAKRIDVRIWLDKDKQPVLNVASLGPGSVKKIGTNQFWLLKDPDEDQLLEARAED